MSAERLFYLVLALVVVFLFVWFLFSLGSPDGPR